MEVKFHVFQTSALDGKWSISCSDRIYLLHSFDRNRNNSVSELNGLREFDSRLGRDLSVTTSRLALGSTQGPVNWGFGISSPGDKAVGARS